MRPPPHKNGGGHAQGSWLNLVEGFFSKLARSVLRQIRVTSKQELIISGAQRREFVEKSPI
jgi:hypothetical protein